MHNNLISDIRRRVMESANTYSAKLTSCRFAKCNTKFIRVASSIDKSIISSEHMKGGFEIRKEIWSALWTGSPDLEMESVYNHHGDYIGDKKTAAMLMEKGIIPEISQPDHSVCSIGYSTKDGKWYGWSHRAIQGFGVGDKAETFSPLSSVKSKDKIKTVNEAKQAAIDFAESVS